MARWLLTPPEPIKCQAPAESSQHPAILGMTRHPGFGERSRVRRSWALGSGVALRGHVLPATHTVAGAGPQQPAAKAQEREGAAAWLWTSAGGGVRSPTQSTLQGCSTPSQHSPPSWAWPPTTPGLSLVGFPCRGPVLVGACGGSVTISPEGEGVSGAA